MIEGLKIGVNEVLSFCPVCSVGKQSRKKFKKLKTVRTSHVGEVVHSDVCGPITPISNGGSEYIVTFMDDYSRKSWVYFLKRKSDVFETFQEFRAMFTNQSEQNINI